MDDVASGCCGIIVSLVLAGLALRFILWIAGV